MCEFYDESKMNRLEDWLKTSLTSRSDLRDKLIHLTAPVSDLHRIQDAQLKQAIAEIVHDELLVNYPKIEKRLEDPEYNGQKYCIHSFVPSKGATPDSDGVFGIMKFRGAFQTEDETRDRTEYLIKNVDSYHSIHEGYVGKPFPVTVDKRYSDKQDFVDVRNKISEVTAEHVKEERKKERKDVEDLKKREEKLQEKVDEESSDPMVKYLETRVKRSHLIFTVVGGKKTINNYLHTIKALNKWLEDKDKESPEYKETFLERFMDARRQTGVPDSDMTLLQYIDDIEPPGLWDWYVEDGETRGLNEELKEKLETVLEQ